MCEKAFTLFKKLARGDKSPAAKRWQKAVAKVKMSRFMANVQEFALQQSLDESEDTPLSPSHSLMISTPMELSEEQLEECKKRPVKYDALNLGEQPLEALLAHWKSISGEDHTTALNRQTARKK